MIKRSEKTKGFTVIDNRLIYDKTLSAKAKGIMLYILSRPDNWHFYEQEIMDNFTDGRDGIRSGIKELVDKGYILRKQKKVDNKWNGYEYTINEIPVDGFPENGIPDIGKSNTNNTEYNNTEYNNSKATVLASLDGGEGLITMVEEAFRKQYQDVYNKPFKNINGTDKVTGADELISLMLQIKDSEFEYANRFNPENEKCLNDLFKWFFLVKKPQKPYLSTLNKFLDMDSNKAYWMDYKPIEECKLKKKSSTKKATNTDKKSAVSIDEEDTPLPF